MESVAHIDPGYPSSVLYQETIDSADPGQVASGNALCKTTEHTDEYVPNTTYH